MNTTRMDRLQNTLKIVYQLKNFKGKHNEIVNLYNENRCHFVSDLKKILKEYVNQDDETLVDYKGTLYFEEIDRNIEYLLPKNKNKEPLFVIRHKI